MAQHDTGLGWNAKDEWLTSNAGLLGGLQEVRFSENLPHGRDYPSIATIVAGGCSFYMDNVKWYVYLQGIVSGGDLGMCLNIQNSTSSVSATLNFIFLSKTNTTEISSGYTVHITNGSDRYSQTAYARRTVDQAFAPGIYGTGDGSIQLPYHVSSAETDTMYCRFGSYSWNDIRADFAQEMLPPAVYFYKANDGYSVACFVKWKTQNNTVITSPILISTVSENTDMTTPGAYNIAKLNALYNGVKFYMSFFDSVGNYGIVDPGFPVIDRSYSDDPTFTLEQLFKYIAGEVYANIQITNSPDPYQEGEGSEEGGADGEEDTADNVDFTDPPSTSIGATGLLTIFCPNLYQLQSLGSFMWSSFDLDNWRKIIANPMDAILGLHILPIPAVITGTKAVKVAGIDTTIDMSYTTVRYIRRTMGTCEIPKKWGAYLDYSPYTKISIFLPFIGFKELDADDVMGKTLSLQYIVDILTGACVAELKCENTVLYTWSGNCANEVPISGSDWRGAIASAIGIAATVAGTALVTGGATAPMAASMVASVGANSMNLKPTINRSGAISGSAGYMGQKRPYIIRSIPNLVIPADQNKFIGYPSFVTTSLGSLTGYNEISSIHLEGIPATGNELAEIETLLKGGVIF